MLSRFNLENKGGIYSRQPDNSCFIVAGGNSLQNFNWELLKDKTVITSNRTLFNVPETNYFITTDYSFVTWLTGHKLYEQWKETSATKIFVANCIADWIQVIDNKIVDTRNNISYELNDFDEIIICKSAKDIGYTYETFNSGYNSGFSTFQLAIVLGYNPIYLLGMDMISNGEKTHSHDGYGRKFDWFNKNLDNYFKHFSKSIIKIAHDKPDLKIISCSKISRLNEFLPYQDIKEIL